jgi:peptidoglycan hydrolase CwlO-like protein
LGQIDAVQARLAQNVRDIQHEIDDLTAQLKSSQDPNRMQLIQGMIFVRLSFLSFLASLLTLGQDLLGQMSRIQEKASESEAIVKDITKDIQILDLAKKNLVLSMTSLKRLQMLGLFTII